MIIKRLLEILKFIVFLSIGILCIWLFQRDLTVKQKHEIVEAFGRANYFWVFVAIIFGVLSNVIRTLRWMQLIEPLGYKPKFFNVFGAVYIGYLANLALPRMGEVTRCGILTKYEKIPIQKALGTVITERLVDMFLFVIVFIAAIALQYDLLYNYFNNSILSKFGGNSVETPYVKLYVLGFMFLILILALIFRNKLLKFKIIQKILHLLVGFWAGILSLSKIKRPWLFIFYSLMIWVMYFFMTWLCLFCLEETFGLSPLTGLAALAFGSVGIMIVQGGIGIYPVIIKEVLSLYGIISTAGYAIGWITWSSQTFLIIIGGVVFLLVLPFYNKSKNAIRNNIQ